MADTRVEHAVSDRARERWLRQLSEDELDLMSVLANLAVRAETVRLVTAGGQHRGVIRSIGADHVCLVTSADVLVVVPMWSASAVFASGVRPAGRIVVPTGPRLNEALSSLATDRPWVQVRVNGHQQLIGGVLELSTAEVVVLSTDVERRGRGGPGRETAYVALSSIAELLLSVSG